MQLHPLIQKLRDHYLEFRRKDYRRMKADGSLEKFLQTRAQSALDQMETLMAQGIYLEQAREIALADLFPPEQTPSREPTGSAETYRLHRAVNRILCSQNDDD